MKPVWIVTTTAPSAGCWKDPRPRADSLQELCLGDRGDGAARPRYRAAAGAAVGHPHARPVRAGTAAGSEGPLPDAAGHHHDRLFRSGVGGGRVPGRGPSSICRSPSMSTRRWN